MKFRNFFKRRPWENPEQKRERKKKESMLGEAMSEGGEPAQEPISSAAGECAMDEEERACVTVGMVPDYGDACLSGDPGQMIALGELSLPPSADNDKVPAPGPIKKETWAEFFGLRFYRLRRWLLQLWATARFQKSGAWLPER